MDRLLRLFLSRFIRRGSITFTTANGTRFTCGDGTGIPLAARFLTRRTQIRILLNPELALGEAFMDGNFVVEQGSIADVLALLMDQPDVLPDWAKPQWQLRFLIRRIRRFNSRKRSRQNVAHHYDLDQRLYVLFLDSDRQYSCAYFETPNVGIEEAQLAKKRHLAAKLLIQRGHRVLDIGCGWGGLGLYLAETLGADVTGVTLSTEQWQQSNARAAERRLGRVAKFQLRDYRDIHGRFDRIVSVGMFEHVGVDFYETFFRHCADLLSDDGVILRLHYAETLKAWRERFMARRQEAVRLYDERFARMWEFYLACSEMAFRRQNLMNMQIQLARRQGVVPMTRDYIFRAESNLRAIDKRKGLRIAGG
jgi:cyclopropane-fatty-acyl-phospholipid synthase